MGFFDYLMKGIGFETETEIVAPKKSKHKRMETQTMQQPQGNFSGADFTLPVYEGENNIQYETQNNGVTTAKNVIVYNPKTQSDIKNLVDFLRRKEPIIVNFGFLPQGAQNSMISFISGALYALRGSIHPIAGELYLLTPEGVNILVPKDQVTQ